MIHRLSLVCLCALGVCAVAVTPAWAQSTCNGSISASHTGGHNDSCPGTLSQRKDYTIAGQTKCNDIGVGEESVITGSPQIIGTATGTCSGSDVQCAFTEIGSSVVTADSGTTITLAWANGYWTGSACAPDNQSEYDIYSDQGPCEGSFCCSGQGTCEIEYQAWQQAGCRCYATPLLVSLRGDWQNAMTSAPRGAPFTLIPNKPMIMVSWPRRAQRNVGWLARDRNGNGVVDDSSELYGSATPQITPPGESRHGFTALAMEDTNADGVVTSEDANFELLHVWFDLDHNGRTDAGELLSLEKLGILSLNVKYRGFGQVDSGGNWFIYEGTGILQHGSRMHTFSLYDVVPRTASLPSPTTTEPRR